MPPHSAGLAPATRVASRKLGPVAGGRSPPSASSAWATRTLATTWGRWLTAAITRSWTSASITAGRAPRPVSSRCRRSSRVPCVVAVGVRYQVAPSKRSSRACSTPAASEPASGWPPTKRGSRARVDDRALGRADVGDDGSCAAPASRTVATVSASTSTGTATKTASAPSSASPRSRWALWIAPRATASSARGSNPRTVAPRRERAASPTDPPMSPTPTTATIKRRRRRPCPRPPPPPARAPRRRRSPRCAAPAARRRWRSRDRGAPRR